MKRATQRMTYWIMVAVLVLAGAAYAQENVASNLMKLAAGQKAKVAGQIVKVEKDSFMLRDGRGIDVLVKLTGATLIKEKKSNPFRGAKSYTPAQLVRGLDVEAEGLGDADGALAARDIKFTQTQYLVASTVETRVTPVEGRSDHYRGPVEPGGGKRPAPVRSDPGSECDFQCRAQRRQGSPGHG